MPPIEEQAKIVSKLQELRDYCNSLEQNIKSSKKDSENLMQAVLQEAFSYEK